MFAELAAFEFVAHFHPRFSCPDTGSEVGRECGELGAFHPLGGRAMRRLLVFGLLVAMPRQAAGVFVGAALSALPHMFIFDGLRTSIRGRFVG